MIGRLVIRNRLVWHESNPSVVGAITWHTCFMFNEMFTHLLQLFSFVYIACILLAKGCWKKTLSVHKPLERKQSYRLLEYNVELWVLWTKDLHTMRSRQELSAHHLHQKSILKCSCFKMLVTTSLSKVATSHACLQQHWFGCVIVSIVPNFCNPFGCFPVPHAAHQKSKGPSH